MTTQVPQCFFCKHYMKPKNKSYTCEAFEGYIPAEILSNEFDHTKSYKGDHGLRYDDIENIENVEAKPVKSAVTHAGFPLGKDITIRAGFPLKGGPGSGNFGHEGRPGELGGSGGGGDGGRGGGGSTAADEAISSIKEPTVIGPNSPLHAA